MSVQNNTTPFLKNAWYIAATSNEIKRNKTLAKKLLGETVLLGRDANDAIFAMQNICPHRGVPLTDGKFDGCEIECCYHGWRFNTQGTCTRIPSLTPCQRIDVSRIKVFSYPACERNGLIWIFMTDPAHPIPAHTDALPTIGFLTTERYQLMVERFFPCDMDHATIGLMDPAHGPFVHRSWWWRAPKTIHEKHKAFGPFRFGFQMREHKPSTNSKAYKIFGGGEKTTEITFQLPGLRIEQIKVGHKKLINVTALTPIDAHTTHIRHFFFASFSWFKLLTPLLRYFAYNFLDQDLAIIKKQQAGLQYAPKLMLINDADTQAKWYFKLKQEYDAALKENRDFVNPVEETILKWRS